MIEGMAARRVERGSCRAQGEVHVRAGSELPGHQVAAFRLLDCWFHYGRNKHARGGSSGNVVPRCRLITG
jgi:hypothetical protein